MRIDPVQVADHVDVKRAAPQRPALGLLVALEMLVQHRVLKFAEGILLRDQPLGALEIGGTQHARGQPDIVVDDQAEIVERRLFLDAEFDGFLGLRLDAVRQIEMDDVARMFEIADIERDFQGAPRFFRGKLGLREIDEIGLDGVLKGVEPLIQRLEQLEGFGALQCAAPKAPFQTCG